MILVTVYKTDQTIEKYVGELEDLHGRSIALQFTSKHVQSITIDKHSKAELKEMGFTHTGMQ
tara:strand:- start:236 stop:421 length:186 start_codon:yes stop_codon:yes gene_type:complete